ncbi:ACT domain-containing protein [uncultured Clostridium sp.]|mgnify:CR=1 FL=1|uniref:ACT domain-containing protein n=1 Tax=uncultured Clostridium sp. TaxID=59620 RepID=UPI0025E73069|nr:ACT domain-containing protein [uncultured Clostridium sp.]
MSEKKLTLRLLNDTYGVCRLQKDSQIPSWAFDGEFYSITKTDDELSIVCLENSIPQDIKCELDWRIFKIQGPLDFSLIGILSKISSLMAENQISIFAVSTYDTDYILIKEDKLENAINILESDIYNIIR